MTGFFVLDVPEFAPLVAAAQLASHVTVHPVRGNYRFVEFAGALDIRRSDTGLNEAVWFGCLTGGLCGKIVRFDAEQLSLVATNEPVLPI
ncbi:MULTISPECIES: hypothetical protein [unclassified Beijerinckia]|uniref:hypothetical protein n=1 Tax=unclassified Beijerinckia TaxID=2638183 RepID=UPI000897084F|nr:MULTISPECIES: hypothetical protein [unclassified Beijerinckia]MDH7795934.1 hypothetical protein [Beijerinckia sp. GAS462]SEC22840.1 hypothetical protein SAMN05443249_2213 [Beijerinckia sp. 28-YEA-48]